MSHIGDVVLVDWRDSATIASRWTDREEVVKRGTTDCRISSVGFVIGQTREFLTIARCLDNPKMGDNVNGALQIPKECIHSLKILRIPATIHKSGSGYKVVSSKGKPLSRILKTKAAATRRLRQVEYFKHHKK